MNRRNAKVVGLHCTSRPPDFFISMVQTRNKDDSSCAVLLCVDGFIDECGVCARIKRAFVIRLLRLMPEDYDYLSSCVDILIIVVMQFGGRNAESGKYKRTVEVGGI